MQRAALPAAAPVPLRVARPAGPALRRALPCAAAAPAALLRRSRGGRDRGCALVVRAEGCPFCKDVGKCISICRNPQNVGAPEAGPSPELSAPSAVCAQLNALQNNSTPRPNHGLQVMYEFNGDVDAFERSRYFGISKDIYQYDHFMSAWAQHYPGFLELKEYDVQSSTELPDGRVEVLVSITGRHAREARDYVFIMKKCERGTYTGCWVTHRLLTADSKFRGVL